MRLTLVQSKAAASSGQLFQLTSLSNFFFLVFRLPDDVPQPHPQLTGWISKWHCLLKNSASATTNMQVVTSCSTRWSTFTVSPVFHIVPGLSFLFVFQLLVYLARTAYTFSFIFS